MAASSEQHEHTEHMEPAKAASVSRITFPAGATSRDKVAIAARHLLMNGEAPSGREVQRLSGGSYTMVYEELKKVLPEIAAPKAVPGLPADLAGAFLNIWEKAVAESGARYQPEITALNEQLRAAHDEVQALTEEAADLRIAHSHAAHEAFESRQRLEQQVAALTQELVERDKALEASQAVLAHTNRQVDALNQQLVQAQAAGERAATQAREFFQQESDKLALRYRDMEDRVMAEADGVRQAAQRDMQGLRDSHKRDVAAVQQRVDQAMAQVEATRREVHQREEQIQRLTQENTRLLVDSAALRAQGEQLKLSNKALQDALANLKGPLPTKGKH